MSQLSFHGVVSYFPTLVQPSWPRYLSPGIPFLSYDAAASSFSIISPITGK